ncbi:MFS transporter [Maritimibacter sp. 55A14]|uniref:MFS transporter n=1 Tax=Maritimibacter sp. 55A14 TaxID=2174844 RepID=UPI000D60D724|nr:MFS transporter [Maritimibacter sp. 55A14]PWE33557.1 MFS transporter [Maritimibacter sp. 55A14]
MSMRAFLAENSRWLAAGALLSFSSSFGQTFFISIYAGEIRAAFGLSHGEWGGIYTLGTTASALLMVWAGGLTDRFRARAIGTVVMVLLAAACLAMAHVSAAWMLPFVIFALRFAGQGMSSHVAMVAMARWFVATRGRALSIATLGVTAGEAFLPMIFVALMAAVHWQTLWLAAAGLALLTIPVLLMLLRVERRPQSLGEGSHSAGMGGRHWTRTEMLRHPLFWFTVPTILAPSAFSTALFFQQVHLANSKGWELVEFVALFPLFSAVSVASMLTAGWALDRWGTARLMPVYQLPFAAGFLVMGQAQSIAAAAVAIMLMAMTVGANATLPQAFWAEFYGTRHIGAIKAMATAVMVFGTALGPGLTGGLIDLGYPFHTQMAGIAVYVLCAMMLMGAGVRRASTALPAG